MSLGLSFDSSSGVLIAQPAHQRGATAATTAVHTMKETSAVHATKQTSALDTTSAFEGLATEEGIASLNTHQVPSLLLCCLCVVVVCSVAARRVRDSSPKQ